MWLAYNAAKRPWPVLDLDPVIDFMILEAVAAKVQKAKDKARKDAEKKQWKENVKQDDELMKLAG